MGPMLTLRGMILCSVSAGMVFAAAPVATQEARACVCGKPTAASYTWDFKGETNKTFKTIQDDVSQVRYHAANLEAFSYDLNVSWDSHLGQLSQLADAVNDLGSKLCRLETIRRVDAPWQRAEIRRIATTVQLMADNAADAMTYLNTHHHELWLPAYRKYTTNLYTEARSLSESVKEAVAYASTSKEYRTLRQELKVPAST